jgi:acetyl-CoA acetyltransferase
MVVYVDGVGMTPFGKFPDRSLVSLMGEAAQRAIDSSVEPEVEALYVGAMNPEEFTGESNLASFLADYLGLAGLPALRVETASSSGASVLEVAFHAVASGFYRSVLAVAGEKMTHLPTPRVTRILAEVIEAYERNSGASMVALAAMVTQAYAHKWGLSHRRMEKVLCHIALKNHRNGSLNPYSQFRKGITEEQYFNSRVISYPLRLYDCAPITDGAAAVILTSEKRSVGVSGIGHGTDTLAVRHRKHLHHFAACRVAAKRAYAMARRSPDDVDLAEVHDAFTCFEVIGAEDLGLFEEGKGWKSIEKGKADLEGEIPINASGGLKARGHPVGASGLAQVVEVVWQLMGTVDQGRQVKNARVGLVHSVGGLASNNVVLIIERSDAPVHPAHWESRFERSVEIEQRHRPDPTRVSREGILDAFTILYVPPEGFPSPLVLGMITSYSGHRILARAVAPITFKVGERVIIEREEQTFYFMRYGFTQRLAFRLSRTVRGLKIKARRALRR